MDTMRALLIEFSYGRVTWYIKSLNIVFVNANMASKEYLIYYFHIIPVI